MPKALLLYPEFSPFSFWNYKVVCNLMGAKYPAAPLGMITLAALLPQEWEIKLIDLNITNLDSSEIDRADLVFIGGMLSQQNSFLSLIELAHARGKKVVAGGPDPTSQPQIYEDADFLVLGEAETSIIPFLNDWQKGKARGKYFPDTRPDITRTPVPRFDLLDLDSYLMIGVQFCRGCPFNCEFCDIIELYGRKPRTKTPQQVVNELQALYSLGYRGHIDFVDDNFIANKKCTKKILYAVKEWSEACGNPFFYSTEASIDLADDDELLDLMRAVDFRYVFIGLESPDELVLESVQKKQNLRRNVIENLRKIYSYGIVVNPGFIIGFDDEIRESARKIVDIIKEGSLCMSMVGLLYALPNTQLTRRLESENRLFITASEMSKYDKNDVDQTTGGLNFVTKRPRAEIIEDYLYVLGEVYATKNYFDRVLQLSKVLKVDYKFKPSLKQKFRYARAFFKSIFYLESDHPLAIITGEIS